MFGDVVNLNTDRVTDPDAEGIERFIGLEHITPEDLRIQSWGSVADGTTFTNYFKPGQVLFGKRRAYQRKVAVADFEGVCSSDIYVFEAKDPNALLPELLPFICQTEGFYEFAVGTSAGSLSPRTNWKHLARYEFALPPLDEQQRITKMLKAIENTLESLKIGHQKAYILWKALSADEFSNIGNGRTEFLVNHYTIDSGQVDPKKDEYIDRPLIAPNHIEGGTGKLLKLETAGEQGAISGKYLFKGGAVIYSKIRPNLMKVVIAPSEGLCSADMYPLAVEPTIRNEYLLEILLSDRFTRFAVSMSMRTGMPKINREQLSKYQCIIPSLSKQDKYLEKSLSMRNAKDKLANRINRMNQAKLMLLQEL